MTKVHHNFLSPYLSH